ncbi:MAG: L,D-transpeptidase family protein [bacterium]|nr:L,D-transpeptidase family protein [Candidatus Sumerlaeota bacterium]
MSRTVLVLVMFAVVAIILAGGTAFIIKQNKLNQMKRSAAQAEEKLDAKEYDDAILLLKRIESEGGTARSVFLLGKAYCAKEQPAEGIRCFNKIERDYPSSSLVPDAMLYQGRYALDNEGNAKKGKEIFLRILEKYPNAPVADNALYYLSRMSYDEGNVAQAKKNLEQIVKKSDSPARFDAEFILGDINMKEMKSPEPGPNDEVYTIKAGDNIWKLERQLKVPGDLIIGINGLNPKSLKIGQQIKVPRLNITIIIDKAQRTITLRNNNAFLKKYRVAINKTDAKAPAGDYTITVKNEKGIEYIDPESNAVFKPGDSGNPLGVRYLQLRRDVGIHGTNMPETVGQYAARGSVGMTNPDIDELYALVRVGTPVTIKGKNLQEGSPVKK